MTPAEADIMAVDRPRVSVCMATYNGAAYVAEQIASILPEMKHHDELVIVDDASTDNTIEVIEQNFDPRIRLLRNESNRGYVHTFERALAEARGDVLFLSDQDDAWMPGRVDAMLDALGDRLMVVSNWKATGGRPGTFERIRLRSADSGHHLRNVVGILVGYRLHWGCAMAVRRELLDLALPFPSWMNESHDQYLAMAANVVGSVRYMETDTVWHRLHDSNLTPQGMRSLSVVLRARLKFFAELMVLIGRLVGSRGRLPARSVGREPSASTIAVVMSAFNPPDDLVARIRDWVSWFGPVVVVDDGSSRVDSRYWEALAEAGAIVLHNPQNMGIAHALNVGVRHAREQFSPDWILTMDQDSSMDADYVHHALETLGSAPDPERVGMIAAASQNGVALKTMAGPRGVVEVLDPMQSGTLVRCDLFDDIGYLRDDYFIDSVDSEFNARARAHGYLLLAAPGCDLGHSLGVSRPMKIAGWAVHIGPKKLQVVYHAPFRVYYITRNNIYTAARYVWRQPVWVARRMWMEVQSHLVRFAFGPNRRLLFIAMAHGFADALRHRTGPIDPKLAERLKP